MPRTLVRDAVLADAAAMSAVQARSWRVAYRGIAPDDVLDTLTDADWVERWTATLAREPDPGTHRLVAELDGVVHAAAACGPAREPAGDATGELYMIYTDPEHWGAGLGSALLREVHARLAAARHVAALLWVAAENDRSIGFYRHHGWELDGTTKQDEVNGVRFDEARMTRSLP